MNVWRRLAEVVAEHGAAALVSVHAVRGSAPRESGARMVVRPDGAFHGTIGGGRLEWQLLQRAQDSLVGRQRAAQFVEQALGPDLGQCCGGSVTLLVETFDRTDLPDLKGLEAVEQEGIGELDCRVRDGRVHRAVAREPWRGRHGSREAWREPCGEALTPVYLFGAGHVGRALVLALAPLPFAVRWIDSRENAFPSHVPPNVTPVLAPDLGREVAGAPEGTFVLVMTHDHALDLAVTAAALRRDFPYVGLIGSDTKRARFTRRLREIGLPEERIEALVSPIGIAGISSKQPALIAASTVAQLLQVREKVADPVLFRHPDAELTA